MTSAALNMFKAFYYFISKLTRRARETGTYVQVDDLRQKRAHDEGKQHVEKPLLVLGLAPDLREDGRTQTLGRDHAQAPDQTADAEVDEHGLLAVAGPGPQRDERAPDDDDPAVDQESRREDIGLHRLDVVDGGLLRRVHRDHDGADDAVEAPDLADEAEPFLEEDGRQDGRDDDGQRAQRRDEDGIDEGVGDEVAHLSDDHQGHAQPPPEVLEVSVPFAGLLVVLDIGLEQADLLEHEGRADEEARGHGQRDADRLVDGRAALAAAAGASHARIQTVHMACDGRRGGCVHDCNEGHWPAMAAAASGTSIEHTLPGNGRLPCGPSSSSTNRDTVHGSESVVAWLKRGMDGRGVTPLSPGH